MIALTDGAARARKENRATGKACLLCRYSGGNPNAARRAFDHHETHTELINAAESFSSDSDKWAPARGSQGPASQDKWAGDGAREAFQMKWESLCGH